MPHVIVNLWPGKSEQQKRRLAQGIMKDVMNVLDYGDESVSVALEEVDAADWAPKVYQPDIVDQSALHFELSRDQIAAIDALDTGVRGGPDPATVTLEAYGKEIPELENDDHPWRGFVPAEVTEKTETGDNAGERMLQRAELILYEKTESVVLRSSAFRAFLRFLRALRKPRETAMMSRYPSRFRQATPIERMMNVLS